MRTPCVTLVLVLAACGGKPATAPGRPQEVAKAAFEALKAGGLGPLEPHLMTPEEAKKIMTVALDDSGERERWDRLIAQEHDRLGVDWKTAAMGAPRVKMDALAGRAKLTFNIKSDEGSATVEIEVLKVGKRYVFQSLKHLKSAAPKQAAPADEGNGDDGCGG